MTKAMKFSIVGIVLLVAVAATAFTGGWASSNLYIPAPFKLIFGNGSSTDVSLAQSASSVMQLVGSLVPSVAGADLGASDTPFEVFVGSTATGAKLTGTFGQATTVTITDPGAATASLYYPVAKYCSTATATTCALTAVAAPLRVFGLVGMGGASVKTVTSMPTVTNMAFCNLSNQTSVNSLAALKYGYATTTLTITQAGTSSDVIAYDCTVL